MTNTNATATKEVRIFQSTAKGAANKKSRVLGAVRKGTMSIDEAKANQLYDVELGKILTVAEIELAATGGGRKRGNGVSNTKGSAVSKASRLTSQYREGKLTKEDLQKALDNDPLLATVTTIEKLTAAPRYTTVSISVPVADEDTSDDDDDDDDGVEDEEDGDDE